MLPQEDWLHIAERLPVGGRTRVTHGRERRPNMVIGNAEGHFWAYCQACREGGKLMKEHVLLRAPTPAESVRLDPPSDLVLVHRLEHFTQSRVLRFLAAKGMDPTLLPPLWYSAARARLYFTVQAGQGTRQAPAILIGRDVSGSSSQKWLTHQQIPYLVAVPLRLPDSPAAVTGCIPTGARRLVLVEDAFSAFKTAAALKGHPEYAVVACLGTAVRAALALEIAQRNFERVILLFDADDAGHRAAVDAHRQLRPFTATVTLQLTEGMDPKDLHQGELARIILGG